MMTAKGRRRPLGSTPQGLWAGLRGRRQQVYLRFVTANASRTRGVMEL
jgi:hypothetical protein